MDIKEYFEKYVRHYEPVLDIYECKIVDGHVEYGEKVDQETDYEDAWFYDTKTNTYLGSDPEEVLDDLEGYLTKVKELYRYTLQNKWYILRDHLNKYGCIKTTWNNKCIFCADSAGNLHKFRHEDDISFLIRCDRCKIDESICEPPRNWSKGGNSLIAKLSRIHRTWNAEKLKELVDKIIKKLESHL